MHALGNTALHATFGVEPTRRTEIEIDALWQLTEQLAHFASRPVAGLELITQTAGELTHADAAAILLRPGAELVLASRWGAVGMPLGYKSADVDQSLDAAWPVTTSLPIRRGARDVGSLWIGRSAHAFSADEERVLRTLASVTSLALPTLTEPDKGRHATGGTQVATSVAPAMGTLGAPSATSSALMPEARRFSVFPPSLSQLLRAIDQGLDVETIAAVVLADPVLPPLVLRASDCAAAGRTRPVESVREAIVFLGLHRIRTLALAKFLQGLVSGPRPLDALLWEQAIGTSVRNRHVVDALGLGTDEDAALLAGLLHPIGAIALASSHPERYERTLRTAITEDRPLDEAEREVFGIDGGTLTRQLLQAWHLGPALATSIRDAGGGTTRPAIDWAAHVSLAANPMWLHYVAETGATVTWVQARIAGAERALGIDAVRAASITTECAAEVGKMRRLLVPTA